MTLHDSFAAGDDDHTMLPEDAVIQEEEPITLSELPASELSTRMVEVPLNRVMNTDIQLLTLIARLIDHIQPFVVTAPLQGARLWVRPDTRALIESWMSEESHVLEKLRRRYKDREQLDREERAVSEEKLRTSANVGTHEQIEYAGNPDKLFEATIDFVAGLRPADRTDKVTGVDPRVDPRPFRHHSDRELDDLMRQRTLPKGMREQVSKEKLERHMPAPQAPSAEFYCENPECGFKSYTLSHAILHTFSITRDGIGLGNVPHMNHQIRVRVIE